MRIATATSRQHRSAIPKLLLAAFVAGALGCASTSPQNQQIGDSLEPINRPVFRFNTAVDDHALGPVARGYKSVTPDGVRTSLANAQRNLGFPPRFVAHVGQANFVEAGSELGRFLLNSTLGVAGLFDPATEAGLGRYDADLGMMFARWHVPPGPYLVLPVLGPSNPRDAVGDLLGMAMNPLLYTGTTVAPIGVLFAINTRAQADDQIRNARASALDYYVFVRDAFVQHRSARIRGEYVTRGDTLDARSHVMADDLYDVE
jgi:phospholipid-binding lipoprotein MlaA